MTRTKVLRVGTIAKTNRGYELGGWWFDAQGGAVSIGADHFMGYTMEELELMAHVHMWSK